MAKQMIKTELEGDPYAIAKTLRAGLDTKSDTAKAGLLIYTALVRVVSGTGTGRVYDTNFYTDKQGRLRKIGKRAPHQASAPGSPPAREEGTLAMSFSYDTTDDTIEIGNSAKHAEWLEYGTSKMQARPFFRNTIQEKLDQVRDIWAKGIERRQRAKAREKGGAG